jgi:hypothetical protein
MSNMQTILLLPPPSVASSDPLLGFQRRVVDLVLQLISLSQQLHEIRQDLPLPATYLGMEDGTVPFTATSLLYVRLSQVQEQRLKPAIEALLGVVQTSDEELGVSPEDP